MYATSTSMLIPAAGSVIGDAPPALPSVATTAVVYAPAEIPPSSAAYRAAILMRCSTIASAGTPW